MAAPARWNGFDAARVFAALCVVLTHSVLTYTTIDLGENRWPLKDPHATSVVFDLLMDWLHSFEMPIFFIASGFFAARVCERRGADAMIGGRIQRVLKPFVVFWIVLFPVIAFGFQLEHGVMSGAPDPLGGAIAYVRAGGLLADLQTYHLWFLYLLMGISAVFWIGAKLLPPTNEAGVLDRGFGRLLGSPWAPLALAVPTGLTLLGMRRPHIDVTLSFLPNPSIVACYLIFFGFGWMLYRRHECLDVLARRYRIFLAAALLIFAVRAYFSLFITVGRPLDSWDVLRGGIPTGALMSWLMCLAIIGGAHAHFSRPSAAVTYLQGASMWVYLIHHPLTVYLPMTLAPFALSPFVKAGLVFSAALSLSLASYELLVRKTLIGRFLNGVAEPAAKEPKAQRA